MNTDSPVDGETLLAYKGASQKLLYCENAFYCNLFQKVQFSYILDALHVK